MVRYTIEGSPIKVCYGYDEFTGVFLTVYDDRLKYQPNASAEVNEVFENSSVSGLASGDGAYLDMHTGAGGFGYKVTWPVMSEYLKRYGVQQNSIHALLKEHLKHLKQPFNL